MIEEVGGDAKALEGRIRTPPKGAARRAGALATAGFVLLSRTDALERYPLRPGSTAIGRSEDNDVVVLDPQVSRHHARIRLAGDVCSLEDLGSANGTRVNGEPVAGSVPLAPGDVIRVAGGEEFRLFKL